jgi:hypothetical protein
MAQDEMETCPICNGNYMKIVGVESNNLRYVYRFECERCGTYIIDDVLARTFSSGQWSEYSHLVSAWIRRENKAGITPNISNIPKDLDTNIDEWVKQLKHIGFPETTNEKMNALL